jgi:hypothetical protein
MSIWKTFWSPQTLLSGLALLATAAQAQVPVDENGNTIGEWQPNTVPANVPANGDDAAFGNEGIPLLSPMELQDLVGPVALYPDDLLAIVLPASTYPLQLVQASRFLESLKSDPSLEPDPKWDDAVVALLNYPEVIELLNEDLDWTWSLGEAVVAQQDDVVTAVADFRNTAYAAGNLQSDEYQHVSRDEGIIEISPASEDIIYVPYYEPEHVVVYQPQPVYHYYTRPRPVYYYPYADNYAFNRGFFWGVTTAFTIGWATDSLHVYHHSYHGHPYYGRSYRDRWWYRRPSVSVHNSIYINNYRNVSNRRYSNGDYWRSSRNTRLGSSNQRITRNVHYRNGSDRDVRRDSRSDSRSRRSSTEGSRSRETSRRNSSNNGMVSNLHASLRNTNSESQIRRSSDREPRAGNGPTRATTSRQSTSRWTTVQPSNNRQSTTRQSTQRQSTARQSTARQSTARQSTARQSTARQSTQRQSTQRQSGNRQQSERREAAPRESRRSTSNQKATSRAPGEKQATRERSESRSSERGNARSRDTASRRRN